MARIAPSFAPLIKLRVMSAEPVKDRRNADADMRIANEIVGDAYVAKITAPADHDAVARRSFDHIPIHHAIGLDSDADAALVDVFAKEDVADEVALHHREPAARFEIRDRDADSSLVHDIVGD